MGLGLGELGLGSGVGVGVAVGLGVGRKAGRKEGGHRRDESEERCVAAAAAEQPAPAAREARALGVAQEQPEHRGERARLAQRTLDARGLRGGRLLVPFEQAQQRAQCELRLAPGGGRRVERVEGL